jgi:hypothetical protein
MTLSVVRTFGVGDHRFRYTIHRDGRPVKKILTDTEARYAVVYPDLDLRLRRDSVDITTTEIEDPDTRILPVITE